MIKRINLITLLTLTITILLLVGMYRVSAVYAQDDGVYKKLIDLQEKFPDGKYWNHRVSAEEAWQNCSTEKYADSYTDTPCSRHGANVGEGSYDCNYFDGGLQCCGFAKKIFYDVFEERESSGSLSRIYGSTGIRVGDYVHFKGFEHFAVVLSVSDTSFTVVECNLDGYGVQNNCIIRWGREYQLSQIDYYVHSNNYDAVNTSCDHSYKIKKTKVATLKTNGYVIRKCKKCGETYKETVYKPTKISVSENKATYTGKAIKIGVVIIDKDGHSISPKYYSVSYNNNKAIGQATATVTFKGRYSGKKNLSYKIVPKGTSMTSCIPGPGSITIRWKKNTVKTNGYQIQYATDDSFKEDVSTVTIDNTKAISKKIRYLFASTKYYIRVRTYSKKGTIKYASEWSQPKMVTTADVATELISKEAILGTYYSLSTYKDKDGIETPSVVKIDSNSIKIYSTEKNKVTDLWDSCNYTLKNNNGHTIIQLFFGNDSFESPITYFKDEGILWIGGEGEVYIFHKLNDKYLNFYNNIESSIELESIIDGTWQDLRDKNSSFDYRAKNHKLLLNLPFFSNGILVPDSDDNNHITSSTGDIELRVEKWGTVTVNEDDKITEYSDMERKWLFVPISKKVAIAYYSRYDKMGNTTWGHGTIFKKIK